jgi:hypothetical protein
MASTIKNGTDGITAAHIRRAVECLGSLSEEQAYDELKSLANQAADEIERLNGEADWLRAERASAVKRMDEARSELQLRANSRPIVASTPKVTSALLDMLPDDFEVVIRRKDGR